MRHGRLLLRDRARRPLCLRRRLGVLGVLLRRRRHPPVEAGHRRRVGPVDAVSGREAVHGDHRRLPGVRGRERGGDRRRTVGHGPGGAGRQVGCRTAHLHPVGHGGDGGRPPPPRGSWWSASRSPAGCGSRSSPRATNRPGTSSSRATYAGPAARMSSTTCPRPRAASTASGERSGSWSDTRTVPPPSSGGAAPDRQAAQAVPLQAGRRGSSARTTMSAASSGRVSCS